MAHTTENGEKVMRGERGTTSLRINRTEMRHIDAAAAVEGTSRGALLRRGGLEIADRILGEAQRQGFPSG